METGNLTLRPNSLVCGVNYDEATNRATGVDVIDTESGELNDIYWEAGLFVCFLDEHCSYNASFGQSKLSGRNRQY